MLHCLSYRFGWATLCLGLRSGVPGDGGYPVSAALSGPGEAPGAGAVSWRGRAIAAISDAPRATPAASRNPSRRPPAWAATAVAPERSRLVLRAVASATMTDR